ncbi:MAG TPA: radical SAM protein [Actinobacteria bacterium]|nr:radical SAM protein [Actinomycetota bacterium]
MRYQKVLLVNISVPNSYLGPVRPPAGLGYVAQALRDNGIEYDVVDMLLGYSTQDLIARIGQFKPDLVGFSLFTFMHSHAYKTIEAVKKESGGGFDIVAGGPHVSTLREQVLEECPAVDFGVVMEGERTLIDLCADEAIAKIPGLIHRDGELVVFNGERRPIRDLNDLSFPRYENFELNRYMLKEILILSSRGCPYRCTYCAANLVVGRKVRMRSAVNVVDEIAYWHERGYRRFNFGDDNFTFYSKRVYEFCDELEDRKLEGLDLRCGNGIRADRVDKPMLERMRQVGFTYIAFGVEAGNDRMLAELKKGEKLETIERSIKDACDLGYDVTLFFLLGSPNETWADIQDSLDLAARYPVMDVRFYNLIPYPRTELFDWVSEHNYFVRQPEDYLNDSSVFINKPIFATPELSVEDRVKALEQADRVERRVLRLAMERRLRRFGPLGKVGARYFSTKSGQRILRHNKIIRAIAEQVRGQRPNTS